MEIAVLICVYGGDRLNHFKESIASIKSNAENYKLKIYLHVDGELPVDMNDYIESEAFFCVVRSDPHVGLALGLNKLIERLGEEDFIFRMDADDIIVPGRFDCQLDYMEKNPKVDVSGGGIGEFLGNERNIVSVRQYPLTDEAIKKTLYRASPFAHVTVCFRKGYFTKFGFYPTSYPFNEDLAYWIFSSEKKAVFGNIDMILVHVRMDGAYDRRRSSKAWPEFILYASHNINNFRLPIFPILRLIFRYFPKRIVKLVYNSPLRKLFT
ncbi:glycosyltransferase [Aeromonas allosaccharophila]|uniref:glycosyltransferase n=1 Tax=Aeromonas allosaccharophila TaxID=656 RepID=UPI001F2A7F7F|nr:glycosyltransferase [Aeromonas allosaccharophila]MCE9850439.1 glycosyltransferase [Aeromonas allosaccharophila]